MSLTAGRFKRLLHVDYIGRLTAEVIGLPLLTELDTNITTESDVNIFTDDVASVKTFHQHKLGTNVFYVTGMRST